MYKYYIACLLIFMMANSSLGLAAMPEKSSHSEWEIGLMNTKTGSVRILLEDDIKIHSGAMNTLNCYAFSRGGGAHIPGGSEGPVALSVDVNRGNLEKALELDGGIPLGIDPKNAFPKFDVEKNYYLIAVMMGHEEYHFVRLFQNGWYSKPSKMKLAYQLTVDRRIPMGKLAYSGTLCEKSGNTHKRYSPVGYYLFPANN